MVGWAGAILLGPIARRLALRFGLVSQPRPDRWAKRPIPLLGGLATLGSASIAVAMSGAGFQQAPRLAGAWTAFLVGLRDDADAMGPAEKTAGILAACVVEAAARAIMRVPAAVGTLQAPSLLPASPHKRAARASLEVLFITAAAHAFNLVDNMDALAAGLAAISTGAILDLEHGRAHPSAGEASPRVVLPMSLLGACCGFLAWNGPPASIMLGDAGSLGLGYLVARAALDAARTAEPSLPDPSLRPKPALAGLLTPALLLCVPAADPIFVLIRRAAVGRSLVRGNTDHVSHCIARLGVPEPGPAVILYAIHAVACYTASRANPRGAPRARPAYLTIAVAAATATLLARRITIKLVSRRSPPDTG